MTRTFLQEQAAQIEYLAQNGWQIFRAKRCKAVAAVQKHPRGFAYKVWTGNARKPCAYFLAKNEIGVEKAVRYYFDAREQQEAAKKARQAEKVSVNASDFFTVGDVVSNSWGYDQTNVDFYQVTRVLNKQIELQQICQNSSDGGGPYGGKCQPRRFEFVEGSKPFRKPIRVYGESAYVPFRHGSGSKWDGKALYCSSYH